MASHGRRAALNALYSIVEAIASVDRELLAAERAQEDADTAVHDARAALERAEGQQRLAQLCASSLHARRDTLVENDQHTRQTLRTMATFPADVLKLIFDTACAPNLSLHDVDTDWTAVRQPYRIVSVCKHWRNVGLDSGSMWAYIAVPAYVDGVATSDPFQDHFRRLLGRSLAASLDVVIGATSGEVFTAEAARKRRQLDNEFFPKIFDVLMPHVLRIRFLLVRRLGFFTMRHVYEGLDDVLASNILDILRCPTPRLVELELGLECDDDTSHNVAVASAMLLPHAPLLRRIHYTDFPVLLHQSHPGLPSLDFLKIELILQKLSADRLWEMVRLAPKLEHLHLATGLRIGTSTRPVSLSIASLSLPSPSADVGILDAPAIALPHLKELLISPDALPRLDIARSMMANSVVTLEIFGEIVDTGTRHVQMMRQFKAVERFSIYGDYTPRPNMQSDTVFDALCDTMDPLWPRLRFLTILERPREPRLDGGLLRVATKRNCVERDVVRGSESIEAARPIPLEELTLSKLSVPSWEALQLQVLLGERCKIVEDE